MWVIHESRSNANSRNLFQSFMGDSNEENKRDEDWQGWRYNENGDLIYAVYYEGNGVEEFQETIFNYNSILVSSFSKIQVLVSGLQTLVSGLQ